MAQFVLIPGAGGDPWYWHLVVELMRERGHSVLAVELPADGIECGLPEYVDAVVDKAGELDDVVLVAQSLGGFTAAMTAARLRAATPRRMTKATNRLRSERLTGPMRLLPAK